MKQRPRVYYSSEQKNLMWDRWQARGWPERVRQLLGYDLYAHYDENIEGGPLGYYKYGSPAVLFESDTGDAAEAG